VASLPSAEAWMVVVPFATAVTNPPCVTVAAAALLLVNKIATPGIAAPAASRGTAVSWSVSPTLVRGPLDAAVRVMEATGGLVGPPPPPQASAKGRAKQAINRRSGIEPPGRGW